MNLTEYQEKARGTWFSGSPIPYSIAYPALGLSSEVGEVLGKLKKIYRDKKGLFEAKDAADLEAELGDVLWYLAMLCENLGLELDEVAVKNLQKLSSRKERGRIQGNGDTR